MERLTSTNQSLTLLTDEISDLILTMKKLKFKEGKWLTQSHWQLSSKQNSNSELTKSNSGVSNLYEDITKDSHDLPQSPF